MEFTKTLMSTIVIALPKLPEVQSTAFQYAMTVGLGNTTVVTTINVTSSFPKILLTPFHYAIIAMVAATIVLSLHRDSFLRKAFYHVPILLLIHAYTMPRPALQLAGESYQFGILAGSWFMRLLDRMYFNDPDADFLRKGIDDVPNRGPSTYNPIKKFPWALELILITRGVGWNWEIAGIEEQVEKPNSMSRAAFVRRRILKASFNYLMLFVVILASRFLSDYVEMHHGDETAGLLGWLLCSPLSLRIFIYAGWTFVVFSTLSLAENLLSIFFVGTGIVEGWSKPSAWPSVFGNISEGYSFRRVWGKWWHQNCRRICSSPGDFIVKSTPALRIPKSSDAYIIRRYLRVMMTFAASAIIHAAGSFYLSRASNTLSDGRNFHFFMGQAVFLLVEDSVCWLLGVKDNDNPSSLRRVIGYAAVHSYGVYSIPNLKVLPLARDCVFENLGSPLIAGVKMVGMGAQGVTRNPFASLIGSLNN